MKPVDYNDSETKFWPVILAIFAQKANHKSFYAGRRVGPTLADIQLILAKLGDDTGNSLD